MRTGREKSLVISQKDAMANSTFEIYNDRRVLTYNKDDTKILVRTFKLGNIEIEATMKGEEFKTSVF